MNINLVVLAGTLAAPVEHRSFESGSHLARLLVTVRTDSPSRRIDVVPVTLWDPPAEVLEGIAGLRVWVAGSVQRRFWNGDDGRRSRLEVVAGHVELRDVEAEGDDLDDLVEKAAGASGLRSGPCLT